MPARKLSNISVKDIRKFLKSEGLKVITTTKGRGGHEKWSKKDLDRPITFQTHINPVPEFIVRQILRNFDMSRKTFIKKMYKK